MKKLFLLVDCRLDDNDKRWFSEGLFIEGYETVNIGVEHRLSNLIRQGHSGRIRNYWLQIKQARQTLRNSGKDDVIIVWYSVTGQIMNLMSSWYGGRNLVLMNFLTPGKRPGILGWMMKKAVSNPRNTILVNSKESIKQYKEMYGLKSDKSAKFYYFPDVYDDTNKFVRPEERCLNNSRYFFTGGMSNRDWKLVCEVAKKLPEEKFVCCAMQKDFESQIDILPKNVEVHYNLPPKEYYNLMSQSHCVLLPLRNDSVAGLINILKSIQLAVLCCVSDTPATRQYYGAESRNFLLPRDAGAWAECAQSISSMEEKEYKIAITELQEYIQNTFSPESALQRLRTVIAEF